MNIRHFFLLSLITFVAVAQVKSEELNVYQQDLKDWKETKRYELVFDEDANESLRGIQADIENYKELTYLQRLLRFAVMGQGVVIVTPETMPHLYNYVQGICTQEGLPVPTIFITTSKGIFNAFAQKLFASVGAILIGQKLLNEVSQDELEAVIAHEIGHIKYNHVNKALLLSLATYISFKALFEYLIDDKGVFAAVKKECLSICLSDIATSLIINKKFEKQADEFAYKTMNKGKGLIEFFENLQEKEQKNDAAFDNTYDLLKENKPEIRSSDYMNLMMRYYLAKTGQLFNKAYRWVYHNTPFGPHPSPQARIKAAQDFIHQNSDLNLNA